MVTLLTVPQMLEVRTVIFLSNLHIAVTTKTSNLLTIDQNWNQEHPEWILCKI